MKKLLVVAATMLTLGLSPLSSLATTATKTSADFTDLASVDAGLKAKIDALLAKGIFEGTSDYTFGIKENMTRAQFAKVLVLIYGVKVDTTLTTSSFADVKADDIANGWAIPYIEAAKKAGLVDGTSDKTFNPGGNLTLGQFATALVKGFGKKVDVTGTPWYKDAVTQAVALNILPQATDGSLNATRADLVTGAYAQLTVTPALTPVPTPVPSPAVPVVNQSATDKIIALGNQYHGAPYVFAGTQVVNGQYIQGDCSGWTRFVFGQLGYHLHGSSSTQAANDGVVVDKSQLMPGDLVFSDPTHEGHVSHVSIYIGNDTLLHTYRKGIGVTTSKFSGSSWDRTFIVARRVL